MLYLDTLSVTINIWKDNRSNKEITKANQNICTGIRETRNKSYLSQNFVMKPQTDLFMLYVNDRDRIKNIYIKLTTKPKITFHSAFEVLVSEVRKIICVHTLTVKSDTKIDICIRFQSQYYYFQEKPRALENISLLQNKSHLITFQ